MRWKRQIFAVAAVALMATWAFGADAENAATDSLWQIEEHGPVFTDGMPRADGEPLFLTRGQSPMGRRDVAVRFGWWITNTRGDLTKIDESADGQIRKATNKPTSQPDVEPYLQARDVEVLGEQEAADSLKAEDAGKADVALIP